MLKGARSDFDLFPWVLGGLLIAAAVPAVVALNRSTNQAPPMAITAAVQPVLAPPPAAPTETPPATTVWQCTVNGQKAFSDSPCGAHASVRQLQEINRMDAAPVYAPYSGYSGPSAYAYAPTDQDAPDIDGGSAPSQFIVVDERRRREHSPLPHHPEHRTGRALN